MKLANLSICLVLAFVLGGCFGGTKSQNITPEPQSLADLKLQTLSLDGQGKLTTQSIKELKTASGLKNTEPIYVIADGLKDKTFANIHENITKSEIKSEFVIVDIADSTLTYITKPVPDNDRKRPELLKPRPMPICDRYPEICLSRSFEKYKNCRNCFTEKIECRQKTNCLADLLEKAEVVKAGRANGKVFTLAEANEAMFAIYDANMTNSKVEKASIQRKAKQ